GMLGLGELGVVVVIVKRYLFIIALDQASAGRVIVPGGQGQAGVFAQLINRLDQAFAEAGLADHQRAVMILEGAGDDFRRTRRQAVDEHHNGIFIAIVTAGGVITPLMGMPSGVVNNKLALFQK